MNNTINTTNLNNQYETGSFLRNDWVICKPNDDVSEDSITITTDQGLTLLFVKVFQYEIHDNTGVVSGGIKHTPITSKEIEHFLGT